LEPSRLALQCRRSCCLVGGNGGEDHVTPPNQQGIELLREKKQARFRFLTPASLPFHSRLAAQERCGGEVPRNPTSSTAQRTSPQISTFSTAFPGKERGRASSTPKRSGKRKEKTNQILEKLSQDPTFLRKQHGKAEFQMKT
jgi:hypothetical protein